MRVGGAGCERGFATWRRPGKVGSPWGAKNLVKCIVGPTKIDVGGEVLSQKPFKCIVGRTKIDVGDVCVSPLQKMFIRWNPETPQSRNVSPSQAFLRVRGCRARTRECDMTSTWRWGEPGGWPKPSKMHGRSYKNRCWGCFCKTWAENAYKMEPRSAVRSKCEPLLSVFEGSGGTHCERGSAVWVDAEMGRARGVAKTYENVW